MKKARSGTKDDFKRDLSRGDEELEGGGEEGGSRGYPAEDPDDETGLVEESPLGSP